MRSTQQVFDRNGFCRERECVNARFSHRNECMLGQRVERQENRVFCEKGEGDDVGMPSNINETL